MFRYGQWCALIIPMNQIIGERAKRARRYQV